MDFMTKAQTRELDRNWNDSEKARDFDGSTPDHFPVIKLFDPTGGATWLISEYDFSTGEAFGLCDLGMGEPELGYVNLNELQQVKGRFGLGIERDLHWTATQPLSVYAEASSNAGQIVDDIPRPAMTRPGDAAAIMADETGIDYSTCLVACNMD